MASPLSARTAQDLTPNELAAAVDGARAAGRAFDDLTVSNPTTAGIPYDVESILAALADPRSLRYEPAPFGLPAARAAVAEALGGPLAGADAERVVLTASTSEAYAFLFKLLCDPGDEVLVPSPSYPLFGHLAAFDDVRPVPYRLAYDGAWHLDIGSLRRAMSARTRAVLVVSPNNPTGSFLKRAELAAMEALGLPIVADEVFASYPLREDPARVTTILESTGSAPVFALGGLSKLAGLPQMKVGWIVVGGPAGAAREALARLELVADTYLSVGTPIQHALPVLLATRGPAATAIRARTLRNLAQLRSRLSLAPSVTLLDVEGGWSATLRLPRVRSETAWALTLLEEEGVLVHPGHFYDFAHEAFVVVSLLTEPAIFDAGVLRLLTRVDAEAHDAGPGSGPRGP